MWPSLFWSYYISKMVVLIVLANFIGLFSRYISKIFIVALSPGPFSTRISSLSNNQITVFHVMPFKATLQLQDENQNSLIYRYCPLYS